MMMQQPVPIPTLFKCHSPFGVDATVRAGLPATAETDDGDSSKDSEGSENEPSDNGALSSDCPAESTQRRKVCQHAMSMLIQKNHDEPRPKGVPTCDVEAHQDNMQPKMTFC